MIKRIAMMCVTAIMIAGCSGNRTDKTENGSSLEKASLASEMDEGAIFLLVGTYTSRGGSQGIYLYRFDTETGSADSLSMVEVDNPSYLTLSPDEKIVYAVSEANEKNSAVYAFSLDKQHGRLEPLNAMPTNSGGPCYITIDSRGKNIHTANYGGGSISSFHVNEDGSLSQGTSVMLFRGSGPDAQRQQSPHVHSVQYTPDGLFLVAADLGTDKLYQFEVNETPFKGQPALRESSFREWETPPGTGPRHFAFHPDGGRFMYLLGELSGEVIVYDYHFGELQQKQVVVADTVGAKGSADIHVSPDGRFLYASNRLEADGIVVFSIDPDDGTLTRVGYQLTAKHPRNFVITPNGKFLLVAGKDDDVIQVFSIHAETGLLTDTGQNIPTSQPACLIFASTEDL